jgi:Protein of unknown function (DUF2939)
MKKLIGLLVLALLGFYVVWPAWSGYQIYTALNDKDASLLERKIDFPSVRDSIRPVVTGEVEKQVDQQLKQAGGGLGAAIGGDLKKQLMPKMVDLVLQTVITPANVIRIASEGGDAASTVRKIFEEQMAKAGGMPGMPKLGGAGGIGGVAIPGGAGGGLGGLGGIVNQMGGLPGLPGLGGAAPQVPAATPSTAKPAAAPAPTTAAGKTKFGFANIKSFGFNGPLGFKIAIAKDPAASTPDVTAGMSFSGFDWKVTEVIPRI